MNIPSRDRLNPEQLEELCDEAYLQELAMQLIALLPQTRRLYYISLRPFLLLRFLTRKRWQYEACLVNHAAADEEQEKILAIQPPVSRTFRRCIELEQLLIRHGKESLLRLSIHHLDNLAEKARWDEFNIQLQAHGSFYKRIDLLTRPKMLFKFVFRVRKVRKRTSSQEVPNSPVLRLRSVSRN